MTRLELSLFKLAENTETIRSIVEKSGGELIVVTKVLSGNLDIFGVFYDLDLRQYADTHPENIIGYKSAFRNCRFQLIRAPASLQLSKFMGSIDVFFVSSSELMKNLSEHSSIEKAKVMLVVELGDNREGLDPKNLDLLIQLVNDTPNIRLEGVATTLGCYNLSRPSQSQIADLSRIAKQLKEAVNQGTLIRSSIGGSALLPLMMNLQNKITIDEFRIGEAIFLGTDGIGNSIAVLHHDACKYYAEVIEVQHRKSSNLKFVFPNSIARLILNFGYQDVEVDGLQAEVPSIKLVGYTSDLSIFEIDENPLPKVGSELSFLPNYRALLRLTTSKYVRKLLKQ